MEITVSLIKTRSDDGQSVNKTTASSSTIHGVGYVRVNIGFLTMTVPHEVNCTYFIYNIQFVVFNLWI